ncbi:MAG: ATP-binding protein [Rhizobacter sp.]|nr:ATP-binding protein [Rhizobacter sp.]
MLLHDAEGAAWSQRNQRWLTQRLAHWCAVIEERADGADGAEPPDDDNDDDFQPAAWRVRDLFGLSAFEAELLLLAAGIEIDMRLREAVAKALALRPNEPVRLPLSRALAWLPEAHWDALSPARPLRHWSLLQVDIEGGLAQALLRIDERVLHHLTGVTACDERLLGVAQLEPAPQPSADMALAERIAAAMAPLRTPLVLLANEANDAAGRRHARALAATAFAQIGMLSLWVETASLVHVDARDLVLLARRIDREAALSHAGVLLALDSEADAAAVLRLLAQLRSPLIVLGALSPLQLASLPARRVLRFSLPPPQAGLHGRVPPALQPLAQRALQQFHVEPAVLDQALDTVAGMADPTEAEQALWAALREAARGGLDALAQRITSQASHADLVLPPFVAAQLREIGSQLRHRQQVYGDWGFGDGQARGLGIAALFAGESGTGKTLAAEVIAHEAGLDLYRIDLACVVSKYIGETEKNLARLFDAAEHSGAVLLFDEADALFGKRSEVKDSHDRYANIEVAYLLQRIESYRGLVILTTNFKSALDRAFLRRIRFVVQFPFPDEAAREQIWRRQFPPRAPLGAVDFAALAKLPLAGGHIRSMALNAAFRAAGRGAAIAHDSLIESARAEFAKLERPFPESRHGVQS